MWDHRFPLYNGRTLLGSLERTWGCLARRSQRSDCQFARHVLFLSFFPCYQSANRTCFKLLAHRVARCYIITMVYRISSSKFSYLDWFPQHITMQIAHDWFRVHYTCEVRLQVGVKIVNLPCSNAITRVTLRKDQVCETEPFHNPIDIQVNDVQSNDLNHYNPGVKVGSQSLAVVVKRRKGGLVFVARSEANQDSIRNEDQRRNSSPKRYRVNQPMSFILSIPISTVWLWEIERYCYCLGDGGHLIVLARLDRSRISLGWEDQPRTLDLTNATNEIGENHNHSWKSPGTTLARAFGVLFKYNHTEIIKTINLFFKTSWTLFLLTHPRKSETYFKLPDRVIRE